MQTNQEKTLVDGFMHAEESCAAYKNDPTFAAEQNHLTLIHKKLKSMGDKLIEHLIRGEEEAASDKQAMAQEVSYNFASYADAMETYADFAAMNRVIEGYNRAQDADREQLTLIELLLKQPYFAKVVLQFPAQKEPKELYIGNAGISDETYKRMIVDWRSPVAEVYYNQENGSTSYRANGRTIEVDLKLRRQFDLEEDHLKAYFDTSVAIQDSLLLASLSQRRSAQMQAITATIQKEQNKVIRHEEVKVLLVSGIAGSGKTSVLLQRIAYLFYRHRNNLDPREVFLITPNRVFKHYIDEVLPNLGEVNPPTLTWEEFTHDLLPSHNQSGRAQVEPDLFARIDKAVSSFTFEPHDFKDLRVGSLRFISADQIDKIGRKFSNIPAGSHKVVLMREEIYARIQSRLKQMAGTEEAQAELAELSLDEQLRLFHETIEPQDEQETRSLTLVYLTDRYQEVFRAVKRDEWLRIDRIGMRLLNTEGLVPLAWLYLKMAITGMGNPSAKYVIIDEVQDYTSAQLDILAHYFRRAHFLLLGDPNQAIAENTATYDDIRTLFIATHGTVEESHLTTSYRSSPEITSLFAALMTEEEQLQASSIQRPDTPPHIQTFSDDKSYETALREVFAAAQKDQGLTAVIVPWKHEAKRLQHLLGSTTPLIIEEDGTLPTAGVVILTLKLAKGLEFDHVILPDASKRVFPDNPLSKRRLYTSLSRATTRVTILARKELTPLLPAQG